MELNEKQVQLDIQMNSIRRDIHRWWRNLNNSILTVIADVNDELITEKSTLAEMLELCKNKMEKFNDD